MTIIKFHQKYQKKKWQYTKEGWSAYESNLNKINTNINTLEELVKIIKDTGETYFKFTSKKINNKPNKPWWNDKCNEIIKKRNKAYNKWRKRPNTQNRLNYKILVAEAKQIIEKEKKESWEKICASINFKTAKKYGIL